MADILTDAELAAVRERADAAHPRLAIAPDWWTTRALKDREALLAALDEARARLDKVLALHVHYAGGCAECDYDYPCPTVRAARGEDGA